MPSITRGVTFDLETACDGMDDGLQARIHDPLWMLSRQWQFGELSGGDSGSPTRVSIQVEHLPLTRYRPAGSPSAHDYSPERTPLETLVESEPLAAASGRDLATRAEAGLHFLRLLDACRAGEYRGAYRDRYRLARPSPEQSREWDPESLRTLDLLAGRVPDAVRLHDDLTAALGDDGAGETLPSEPAIAPEDRPRVLDAARTWLRWFETQGFSQPTDGATWVPERMEYAFAVGAGDGSHEAVLAAPEYHGGRLDWDSFVAEGGTLGSRPRVRSESSVLLPTPVAYRGMPNARFWAFEDGRVNLGAADEGSPDLASRVLVEFAMVYGNDWFLAPVEVAVGSLARVETLVVRDSFGVERTIPHYTEVDGPDGDWCMFSLTSRPEADPALVRTSLLVTPTLAAGLEGGALEEVLFLRDEMADMAWAVERVVQGPAGRPLDRYEGYQATQRETPPAAGGAEAGAAALAELSYRLGTRVPDYWIPLLPEAQSGSAAMRLRRGAMPRFDGEGGSTPIPPRGSLLRPGRELVLFEEEVPREGIRVTRACQYARWIDGSLHLWIGAHKLPGRGEGSSGLRFDAVEPAAGVTVGP